MTSTKELPFQCELINTGGSYPRGLKKIYQITDEGLSMKIMLNMFKLSSQTTSDKRSDAALKENDVKSYIRGDTHNEPLFNRNFTLVTFSFSNKDDYPSPLTTRFFRYSSNMKREDIWVEIRDKYSVLDKKNLTFNESLFVLYGFNCVLIPDYDIKGGDYPIDKALINTKQGDMLQGFFADDKFKPTGEFIKFAEDNNFLKMISGVTAQEVTEKEDRNKKILKIWKEESPFIGDFKSDKYKSKSEVYEIIKNRQRLGIKIDTIGRIISKEIDKFTLLGKHKFPNS